MPETCRYCRSRGSAKCCRPKKKTREVVTTRAKQAQQNRCQHNSRFSAPAENIQRETIATGSPCATAVIMPFPDDKNMTMRKTSDDNAAILTGKFIYHFFIKKTA
jgi:hypothetical protein